MFLFFNEIVYAFLKDKNQVNSPNLVNLRVCLSEQDCSFKQSIFYEAKYILWNQMNLKKERVLWIRLSFYDLHRHWFSTKGEVGASVEDKKNTGKEEESKEPNGGSIRDYCLWNNDIENPLNTTLIKSYDYQFSISFLYKMRDKKESMINIIWLCLIIV